MSTSSIETLVSARARIAKKAGFPPDCDGTASPKAHRASEAIQERIREHIVAARDRRLLCLLHLLGQASLRMEQVQAGCQEFFEDKVSGTQADRPPPAWPRPSKCCARATP
jgi:hypothetical protein